MLNEAAGYAAMMNSLTGRRAGKITMQQLGFMDQEAFAQTARKEMQCPGGLFGSKGVEASGKDIKLTFTLPPFSKNAEMTYVVN